MFPVADRLQLLTPLIAVVTLPLGILTAIFASGQIAIAVFVVGWLLLVPLTAILFGPPGEEFPFDAESAEQTVTDQQRSFNTAEESATAPIEEVRQRYARGEIDEVELERRLEALLETEDVDPNDEAAIRDAAERIDTAPSGESPVEPSGERPTEKSETRSVESETRTEESETVTEEN